MRREARDYLAPLGLEIDVGTRLGNLRFAQKHLAGMAKAPSHDARVFILDGPTAARSTRFFPRSWQRSVRLY